MATEAGGPVKFLPVTHAAPPGIHLLLATRVLPVMKIPVRKDLVGLICLEFNVWRPAVLLYPFISRFMVLLVHSSLVLQFFPTRSLPVIIFADFFFFLVLHPSHFAFLAVHCPSASHPNQSGVFWFVVLTYNPPSILSFHCPCCP